MRKNVTVYVMPNHQQDAKSFCWQTVSTCVRLDISVGDIAVSLRSRVFHDSHNPFSVPTCIGQLKIDSYSFLPFSYFLNLSPSLSRVTLSSRTWSQPPFTFVSLKHLFGLLSSRHLHIRQLYCQWCTAVNYTNWPFVCSCSISICGGGWRYKCTRRRSPG